MFENFNSMNRKRCRWRKMHFQISKDNISVYAFLILSFCGIFQSTVVATDTLVFEITENLPKDTEVGVVDGGTNRLYLTEKSSGVADAFDTSKIEASGRIVTITKLNREDVEQYNMTLYNAISDVSYKVTVNVLDVNDNSPTFDQETFTLEISELAKIGSEYNLGSAVDNDAPPNNVQGYRMVELSEYFGVNTTELKDGNTRIAELVVLKKLDRENISSHVVTIEAFDGGVPTPNTGRIVVNVSVSDSNDNPPNFDRTSYNATISENAPVSSDVTKVRATDRDAGENGDVTYSIDRTKGDPDEFFKIDSISGAIYLNKKLDSETATEHRLTVLAHDGGAQPQVGSTLVIIYVDDVNDNKPTINVIFLGSNEGRVSEGAEIGDYIARISVTDPDVGDVEKFNVIMIGGDDRFGLKTDNNVVYLIRVKEKLNREEKSSYKIVLNATDFGSPPRSASASFTIEVEDINDNPPRFDKEFYEVEVSEKSYPGTFVIHLAATDLDIGINNEFEYSLKTSDQSDWFDLNTESGLITTASYLDYEVNPEVRLIVVATDFGQPRMSSSATVIVKVGNANDTAPVFESKTYRKTIPENSAEDWCFLQVKATDPDFSDLPKQIVYTFAANTEVSNKIILDSSTGELCIHKELDRETNDQYNFRIKATDKSGQHDFTQVFIEVSDINDNRPEFHPLVYVVNVAAATSLPGDPVTQVIASDDDDSSENGSGYGVIIYEILAGNDEKLFSFDNKTGEISIAKPLAAYGNTVVELRIRAVDGGDKSSDQDAVVTISILNDTVESTGGPVFQKDEYRFSVLENAKEEKYIGRVSASAGGSEITYFIRNDPPISNWFSIDSKTGNVTVSSSSLDREIFAVAELQVIASAGSPPIYAFCDLTITLDDVNDNAPIFDTKPISNNAMKTVKIPYSISIQTPIYTVNAMDSDIGNNALIRYSLVDDAGYFTIHMNTGELKLRKSLPHQNRNYSVIVQASDHGNPPKSTTGKINIEALQPDGSCPTFSSKSYSVSVSEDTALATSFRTIAASSSSGVVYRLTPSIDSYNFGIYSDGSLYLTSKLDREIEDKYVFEIVAEGVESHVFTTSCVATATVDVTVTDVNDNVPYFDPAIWSFTIAENLSKDSFVGKVIAADNDIGANSELRYSLAISNSYFKIDSVTGIITTLQVLDHESISSQRLTIQTQDISEKPLMSQMSVRIYIEDKNDNSPQFLYTYTPVLSVIEDKQSEGLFVALLQATDKDSGNNGNVKYAIKSGGSDKFKIDSEDGSVTTATELNADAFYSLILEAEDEGNPARSSEIRLEVRVVSKDENSALFDENEYAFFANGNIEPGDILGRFKTSVSSSRNSRFVRSNGVTLANFYISEGDTEDVFYINRKTGELSIWKKLNYETKPQYNLRITAENSNDAEDIYTFQAQVNIEDGNDFSPEFNLASYSIPARENIPINTKIWSFTAIDGDIGSNGEVMYSILNQSSTVGTLPSSKNIFRIDSATGDLFTNANLDRESIPEYTLVIKATDGSATDPRSATVSAVVTVQDMNDNRPTFLSRSSTYVSEDESVKFPVLYVVAEDEDLGENSHVVYSINQQWSNAIDSESEGNHFQLNPVTGLITLIKKLDYEAASKYFLNISATDTAAIDPLSSSQLLTINVVDVNDETPQFTQDLYFAEIEENQDAGNLVDRVKANDGDSGENGQITYELHDLSNSFKINQNNGVITSTKRLDREIIDTYTLTVYAHDRAFPSLYSWCSVQVTVVDLDDNFPKFATDSDPVFTDAGIQLTSIEIPEYEPGPALVYTVIATDLDGEENGLLTYSIEEGNTGGSFTINSTTGQLLTSRRLDRETTSSYRLKIVATDNGFEPKRSEAFLDVTVLDWNDNDPVFTKSSYQGEVPEGLPSGQFVLAVHADDADLDLNGEIHYSIDPGTRQDGSDSPSAPEGLFAIDENTGVITTTATLDREKKSSHRFTVQATDSAPYGPRKASVPVTIDVHDVNDNFPTFSDNLIVKNVSSTIGIGSDIATLTAQDKDAGNNGTIFYKIIDGQTSPHGSWENKFQIDNNGRITTTFALSGTYTYYLNISASDYGTPPKSTDAVVVVNVEPFDVPNFTRVQFQKKIYEVDIPEITQENGRVTQVQAKLSEGGVEIDDDDQVNIIYDFASGNEDNTFVIASDGIINVKQPSHLDYETLPEIRLIVSASAVPKDGGGPMYAYSTVYVNLLDNNDNSPRFAQARYVTEVWEGQDRGTYVLQVSAHDIDSGANGDVRYYIESGNTDQSFAVDGITGIVTTARKLDREIHNDYKLTVHAYDLGTPRRTGSCLLKVTVVDINDHEPTLNVPARGTLSVTEKIDIGTLITKVTANDPDLGTMTFKFSSDKDNQNEYFTIDKQDGTIHLAKSLDYEVMHQATIKIQAFDGQFTDEKNIVLNIEDDNDNSPVFEQQSYQTTLDELSPLNTSVIKVHANDADSGNNGFITYKLINTLPNKPMFTVDKFSGMIYTNMTESFNPQSSIYNLLISSEDNGDVPRNNTVSVRIQIKDVNNHSPVFGSDSYKSSVSEAAERNTHVINVSATDADFSKENRYISYKITSGNVGNAFKINTHTATDGENTVGEICVANDLDREDIAEYTLTITAYDQGTPRKTSETLVTIAIDDVNDNQPIFNQTSYSASVPENADKQPVVMVFASDPDSSSSLIFKITAGNEKSFEIGECEPSSAGCALITANKPDYETKSSYNLTVQVWDGRNTVTSRSSITTVRIDVLDENEHPPYITWLMYYYKKVSESVGANQTLFTIPGRDEDGGVFGELYYTIINGNISVNSSCLPADQMFMIVQKTGEVRSRKPFDYEKCRNYKFRVKIENAGTAQNSATLPVEVIVTSVDEFSPIFSSDDLLYKFKVPYSADEGYIVGTVNATDADHGLDGKIVYNIVDEEQEFVINSTSGEISLSRKIENSNNRVLKVTATSRGQVATTLVTIEIEGAPTIAIEAQILSIVFGVIAGIAVVILVILCVKHRRNKKAKRPGETSSSNIASDGEHYDPTVLHRGKNGVPIPTPRRSTTNSNRNSKSSSTKNSSEYQMRRTGSGHTILTNGVARRSITTNGHLQVLENGSRSKSNSGGKINNLSNGHAGKMTPATNGHVVQYRGGRHSLSSGRGSTEQDDPDDKEVDRINSSSDITNNNASPAAQKPKIRKKVTGQGRHKKHILDSGIQKDLDIVSDISDGPIKIKSPSVESIHVFGDEGAGEEPLNMKDIETGLETEFQNELKENNQISGHGHIAHLEEPTSGLVKVDMHDHYKSPLGTESNKSSLPGRSTGAESGYSRRDHLTNWAPEFQPLANVFSEIAKLKDREAAARTGTFVMKDLTAPGNALNETDMISQPPPLITSVADQRNNLVAPVPLGYNNRVPARRAVGSNLVGLYPNSNPQYVRPNANIPQTSYLTSLYSNAILRHGNMPKNNINMNQGRSHGGFAVPQATMGLGVSSLNSSQQGLSVSSLPRTPISHESSFTSPAMSPNLTPSLSPLATRSPSVSTVGETGYIPGYDSDDGASNLHLSRSDPNLASYRVHDNERMVHV